MFRYIVCFSLVLLSQVTQAQAVIEKGVVLDKITHLPIAGASVFINASGIGTVSATDGSFNVSKFIQAQFAHPVLTIVAIGYETVNYNLANVRGEIVIYMNPVVKELETVTVTAAEKTGWEKYG